MKKIDWSQWFLFVIGVVVVEVVSIFLLWKAYPGQEMKVMGWAILILVLGFSGYATYKADEPDANVRQVGIGGKVVLALLGVAALWGHSSMSRELSTSREAGVEYEKKMKFKNNLANEKANRDLALKRAETEQMAAQARLEGAQAQKLRLLDPSQRRALALPKSSASANVPGELKTGDDAKEENIHEPRLEAAVREDWMTFFQIINFLQILCAVVGALAVNVVRHWDRKGIIGVPDFIERVWHSGQNGQDYVRTNYASFVPMLEGSMGNATT